MRRCLSVGLVSLTLLVAACQASTATPKVDSPNAHASPWLQVDLPGLPDGTRKAVYDAKRDAIWVVSEVPPQVAGASEYMTITRIDAATRAVTPTGVRLTGRQLYLAAVALDQNGDVWLASDRKLVRYQTTTGRVETFALPSFASLGVQVSLYSGEGVFLAVTVDSKGEVWTAAEKVAALFGFNPSTNRWDRVIHLPWFPNDFTTLAQPRPGLLTVNGFRSPDGKAYYGLLAEIDTTTNRVRVSSHDVRDYFPIGSNAAIYLGPNGDLYRLDLDTDAATDLVAKAPVDGLNGRVHFATSSDGHIWFTTLGHGTIGLGVLDTTSLAIDSVPFPYAGLRGGAAPNEQPCPPAAFDCIPSGALRVPEIEAVIVDRHEHAWVITDFAGRDDPHDHAPMTPVIELKAADR